MARDQVFISYSHADSEWLEKLQIMLEPLQRQGMLDIWADTRIQPGQLWKEEIQKALAKAKVAVLLVSPDFLASEFINKDELPLLEAARKEELTILWIPVRHSLYEETNIAHYQAAYNPKTPLATLKADQQDDALVQIAKTVKKASATSSTAASSAASTVLPEVPTRYSRVSFSVRHKPAIIIVMIGGFVVLAGIVWQLVTSLLTDRDLDRITGKSDTEIVTIATQKLYTRLNDKPNIGERMRALRVLKSRAEEAPTPASTYWEQVMDVLTNYIRYNIDERRGPGLEVYEDRGTFRPEDIVLALKTLQTIRETARKTSGQNLEVDLHDINFRNLNFTGLNLEGFNFSYSSFDYAFLSGCICQGAKFRFAHFRGAAIWNASFQGVDFYQADLADSKWANVDFTGSNLEEAVNYDKVAVFAKPKGLTSAQAALFPRID